MALRDTTKDPKSGEYVLEARTTQHTDPKQAPMWVPVHVHRLAFNSPGGGRIRAVTSFFCYPWQAEQEAQEVLDKQRGVPAVLLGALEVRVRCSVPASNVPIGPAVTREWTHPHGASSEFGKTISETVDTRVYHWKAQPDHEGMADLTQECVVTGARLHPIYSCRLVSPTVDADEPRAAPQIEEESGVKAEESPEPEPQPAKKVAKKKTAKKKVAKKKAGKPSQLPPGAEF